MGRRPVVIHLITRLILGGPTRPVLAAMHRLDRHGLRPVLITGAAGRHEAPDDAALRHVPDLPVLQLAQLVRPLHPWRDLRCWFALRGAIRRLAPLVLHTHTAKAGALGRLARWRSSRRPVAVHTFHGHSMNAAASGRAAPVWRAIERWLARHRTDLIIALSPGQRSELIELLGPRVARKLVVLPLPFDTGFFAAEETDTHAAAAAVARPDERTLVFLGRGVPVKGLDHLARAFVALAARDPLAAQRLRVVLVGPIEPDVAQQVRDILGSRQLGERWTFWGATDNPLPLLRAADGLVLPSRSEGTPVSILEALWVGLPVLAADVGAVGELLQAQWVRHGVGNWTTHPCAPRGLVLPCGDDDAWAQALQRFVNDPSSVPGDPQERRRFVQETFDPEQHVDDLAELYASLQRWPGGRDESAAANNPIATAGDQRPAFPRAWQ